MNSTLNFNLRGEVSIRVEDTSGNTLKEYTQPNTILDIGRDAFLTTNSMSDEVAVLALGTGTSPSNRYQVCLDNEINRVRRVNKATTEVPNGLSLNTTFFLDGLDSSPPDPYSGSLLAHWPLNESMGSTVLAYVGGNGQYYGDVQFQEPDDFNDLHGGCTQFNGGHAIVPFGQTLGGSFTFILKFKVDKVLNDLGTIFSSYITSHVSSFPICVGVRRNKVYVYVSQNTAADPWLYRETSINLGEWYYLYVTASDGSVRIALNDFRLADFNTADYNNGRDFWSVDNQFLAIANSNTEFIIGNNPYLTTPFYGQIADIKIASIPLTFDEIAQDYNKQSRVFRDVVELTEIGFGKHMKANMPLFSRILLSSPIVFEPFNVLFVTYSLILDTSGVTQLQQNSLNLSGQGLVDYESRMVVENNPASLYSFDSNAGIITPKDIKTYIFSNASSDDLVQVAFAPLTTNSLPAPFIASASSTDVGFEAFKAFDNDSLTYWRSDVVTNPISQWLELDLGVNKFIVSYSIQNDHGLNGQFSPNSIILQGTSSKPNWVNLDVRDDIGELLSLGQALMYTVSNPGNYRYYRIVIDDVYQDNVGDLRASFSNVILFERS